MVILLIFSLFCSFVMRVRVILSLDIVMCFHGSIFFCMVKKYLNTDDIYLTVSL